MSTSRLSVALDAHGFALDGLSSVNVYRARTDFDYGPLKILDLCLIQSSRVEFEALTRAGFPVTSKADRQCDLALVQITRSKDETMGLVAQALTDTRPGGPILVDGSKTDGIDSILKRVKKVFALGGSVAKSHGKLFWFTRPAELPEQVVKWANDASARLADNGFWSAPGMFSHGKTDPGSALLIQHLDRLPAGRIADLGAGWGFLARAVLKAEEIAELHLFEAEQKSLDAARNNLEDDRAVFHWADVTKVDAKDFDGVVSNPPFHQSRAADPALGRAFIAKAADMLKPDGVFLLVANRHLPYEREVDAHFQRVETLEETHHFKVICATRPFGPSRKARPSPVKSR